MKAAVNVALTAIVGVMVVVGVSSFTLVYKSDAAVKGINERNVMESLAQMEFVKKAIVQSATYSVQQEAYELLKYGGYDAYGNECDPSSTSGYPADSPYWLVLGEKCFPSVQSSLDAGMKDGVFEKFAQNLESIRGKFNDKLKLPEYLGGSSDKCPAGYKYSAEKKTCMCDSIGGDESECPLGEEHYTEVRIFNDNSVYVKIPQTSRLEFKSETLELSDNADIRIYADIPLGKILKFANDNLDEINKYMSSSLKISEDEMKSVDYDGKPVDCTKIEYANTAKYCGQPKITETKKDILDISCPNALERYEDGIIGKVSSYGLVSPDKSFKLYLAADRNRIGSYADVDIDTCESGKKENYDGCSCASWACAGTTPVKFGADYMLPSSLPFSTSIDPSESGSVICSPCAKVKAGLLDDPDTCEQFVTESCPEGFGPTSGVSALSTASISFATTPPPESPAPCVKSIDPESASPICGNPSNSPIDGKCYDSECLDNLGEGEGPEACIDPSDSVVGCPSDYTQGLENGAVTCKKCPAGYTEGSKNGAMTCERWSDKKCPGDLVEFENTGRCYKLPTSSPSCVNHETLYTKTCTYDYSATANVAASLESDSKHSVYDPKELTTKQRNLELDFHILSKN